MRLLGTAGKRLRGRDGQTFILVMTVTALATVLGLMAMSGALLSIRLYGMKRISDKNFYKLEMAVEEIRAGLTRDVVQTYFGQGGLPYPDEDLTENESAEPADTEEGAEENAEEITEEAAEEKEGTEDPEEKEKAEEKAKDKEETEKAEEQEKTEETEEAEETEEPEDTEDMEDGQDPYAVSEEISPIAMTEGFLRYQVGIFDPSIFESTGRVQMDTRKEAGQKVMESYLAALSPSVTPEGTRSITADRTEELSVQVEDIKISPEGMLLLQGVHLVLTNYERDARAEIVCDIVIPAFYNIRSIDEVVLLENWQKIG